MQIEMYVIRITNLTSTHHFKVDRAEFAFRCVLYNLIIRNVIVWKYPRASKPTRSVSEYGIFGFKGTQICQWINHFWIRCREKKTSITLGRENILNSKREDPSLLVNKKKLTYKNIVGRGKTKNWEREVFNWSNAPWVIQEKKNFWGISWLRWFCFALREITIRLVDNGGLLPKKTEVVPL